MWTYMTLQISNVYTELRCRWVHTWWNNSRCHDRMGREGALEENIAAVKLWLFGTIVVWPLGRNWASKRLWQQKLPCGISWGLRDNTDEALGMMCAANRWSTSGGLAAAIVIVDIVTSLGRKHRHPFPLDSCSPWCVLPFGTHSALPENLELCFSGKRFSSYIRSQASFHSPSISWVPTMHKMPRPALCKYIRHPGAVLFLLFRVLHRQQILSNK